MNRTECLESALKIVNGQRQQDYGTPENNFKMIADLWSVYLSHKISVKDVPIMMALLKIARIQSGHGTEDSYIDLAGYAACGAEIQESVDRVWEDD